MIDIKLTAVAAFIGLLAVDSGVPTDKLHGMLFTSNHTYTSEQDCVNHVTVIERQRPALTGTLTCKP